jgi:hypothetical protein
MMIRALAASTCTAIFLSWSASSSSGMASLASAFMLLRGNPAAAQMRGSGTLSASRSAGTALLASGP